MSDGLIVMAPAKFHRSVDLSSDAVLVETPSAIYVGTGGSVVCSLIGDPLSFLTYKNVVNGMILDIRPHTIKSTANGTTAADIIALGPE